MLGLKLHLKPLILDRKFADGRCVIILENPGRPKEG
jgi:hypothetical protein